MLSKELEYSLNHAFKEARDKHHEFMTVEHLLLALLDNPTANPILAASTTTFHYSPMRRRPIPSLRSVFSA
jgi:ATP-dependent Clp protease ATP-binding subunit ClpA